MTAPNQEYGHQVAASQQDDSSGLDALFYARVILSYWWLLAPLAVLGGLGGLIYSNYLPPRYRATCRFEIYRNPAMQIRLQETPGAQGPTKNPIQHHVVLLRSNNLRRAVRKQLRQTWDFEGKGGKSVKSSPKLRINPVREASPGMLDIAVDSFDAQYSLEYIEILLEEFRQMRLQSTAKAHEETLHNLNLERESLHRELEDVQKQVVAFETRHNVAFSKRKQELEAEHLAQVLNKQRNIRTQRTILESQFPFLTSANAATLQDVMDLTKFTTGSKTATPEQAKSKTSRSEATWSEIPQWRDNQARIIRLENEYKHRSQTYKADHPKMRDLQEAIETARRELQISADLTLKRLNARQHALQMQEDALMDAAEKIQKNLRLDAGQRATYSNLKARAQHLKQLYDKVFTRIIELSSTTGDQFFSRVIDGPSKYSSPIAPVKSKFVIKGIMLALALGGGLIFLIVFRQHRLYNYESIEVALNVPCIAGVSRIPKRTIKKNPLFLNELPKSNVICESYRTLRTGIEQAVGSGKVVVFTSPDPGDGKTFTSLNVALAFSWGRRTLVMDGDFRRVSLRKAFRKAPVEGIMDYLQDEKGSWRDYVVKDIAPNLDYMPAGHVSENTTELLETGKVEAILDEMRNDYDMVIVDSAPVNHVVDTILLAKQADAVAIVARTSRTSTQALRYAINRLHTSHLIGFIQNHITRAARKYHRYYGYGSAGYYSLPYAGYYGGHYE